MEQARIECTSLPTLNVNGQNTANASALVADGGNIYPKRGLQSEHALGSHGKGNGKESGRRALNEVGGISQP